MKRLIPLIAMLILTGCMHHSISVTQPRMVQHVVIAWLKEPGNIASKQQLLNACIQLTKIPGVIDVKAGDKIASDRPVVDSTYDLALIVTFTDQSALQAYLTNPIHLKLLDEQVKPLVARMVIYDSSIDMYSVR